MKLPVLYEFVFMAFMLVVIDYIYLKNVSNYFNSQVEKIQGSRITLNMSGALLCYVVIVLSLYYFIIRRRETILNAMLFGWSVYLIYELTNKAIFNEWKWNTVLIDGIWGGLLYGLTTLVVYSMFGIQYKWF
jgi:uncharacterized membrane protein